MSWERPATLTDAQRRMFCLVAQQVSEHLERRHDFGDYIAQKIVLAAVMNSVAAEIIH